MRSRRAGNSAVGDISWTQTSRAQKETVESINQTDRSVDFSIVTTDVNSSDATSGNVVVIEKRSLFRECLTRALAQSSGQNVLSFSSVESWIDAANEISASLVVLCIAGKSNDLEVRRDISLLAQCGVGTPTVIMSDVEDPDQIVTALERGARGYIPTSVSLEVAIEAMHLVCAGGVFVPASSLIAARRLTDSSGTFSSGGGMFTARQAAVVDALRRGKANKVIAHELTMRESTVKVHVRNIMKKLKAKNRTEVAFMLSERAELRRD